ncbi:MAG: molecular chaperone HtpG [Clostridia bacterium]|nr:molecular chaperone HtpG [Clostridia bacterium]
MAKKQFKAESKRLLDLMINSIYTHKEIFLRELISNASDAMDKLYYKSLNEGVTGLSRDDFEIRLEADKDARVLRIRDNGIGMTQEELDQNLGVIAKSGSLKFKSENEKNEDIDIIGQFGVGFYSAFMVADHVRVESKAFGAEQAYVWESDGADGYTVRECMKAGHGTEITLHIKNDTEDENYSEFLDTYRLRGLIKRYSDYIRYPIRMEMEKTRVKEGTENEYEHYFELETLNSMVPLWKKNRSEIEKEEYNSFYKEKFFDWQDPLKVIHTSAEGTATYNALLFIPSTAPMDYYSRDFEKGLQLYASGVLIMDKCSDLLPDYFGFVKGLVDSQDLSLNISREMLQHDRQLKLIAGRIEKKISSELKSMLEHDREAYEKLFKNFGLRLKFGMYDNYGVNKDKLKDLVLFMTSSGKMRTLKEYVADMKEDQPHIYYASGETAERIAHLPQTEAVLDRGYEVLYLTDDVDEFALMVLGNYEEKTFKNVSAEDARVQSEEEKAAVEARTEENRVMLEKMQEILKEKVKAVRLSTALKKHPVCITTDGALSMEMEKVLNSMPGAEDKVKAEQILEINADHAVFSTLRRFADDADKLKKYTEVLYSQALLIEGRSIEDPVAYANTVAELLSL